MRHDSIGTLLRAGGRANEADNLKSGVTERVGDVVRFNRHFLDLATHYAFEPHAAGVRRGNE